MFASGEVPHILYYIPPQREIAALGKEIVIHGCVCVCYLSCSKPALHCLTMDAFLGGDGGGGWVCFRAGDMHTIVWYCQKQLGQSIEERRSLFRLNSTFYPSLFWAFLYFPGAPANSCHLLFIGPEPVSGWHLYSSVATCIHSELGSLGFFGACCQGMLGL